MLFFCLRKIFKVFPKSHLEARSQISTHLFSTMLLPCLQQISLFDLPYFYLYFLNFFCSCICFRTCLCFCCAVTKQRIAQPQSFPAGPTRMQKVQFFRDFSTTSQPVFVFTFIIVYIFAFAYVFAFAFVSVLCFYLHFSTVHL